METMESVAELIVGANRMMADAALCFDQWLAKPETQETVNRASRQLQAFRNAVEGAMQVSAQRHADAVELEKRSILAAATCAPRGLHKADIPGLLSLNAPADLIALAETGGRARPRIHRYRTPAERCLSGFRAFDRLLHEDPAITPGDRREAFEFLRHRDLYVHAIVCGELGLARALGLRGEEARTEALNKTASVLREHAAKGMKNLTPTAVMRTYRWVERLATEDRPAVVLPAMTAQEFGSWMTLGCLPQWLQR